jgi:uncharacterized protein YhfF
MGQWPDIESFWQAYLASLPVGTKPRMLSDTIWQFGDTNELATRVGHLVSTGVKTATSALVWEMDYDGETPPQVGEIATVANGDGEPLCLIEITQVAIKPFNAIDEQFAFEYGENDRTLQQWRAESWKYFAQRCAVIRREPNETMPLVCLRFRLLYPKH